MSTSTRTRGLTAAQVAKLHRKLQRWQDNLAANEQHYMADGRPEESLRSLRGQLDMVTEVLELLDEL